MAASDPNPRGAITAAEIAVAEQQFDTAEDALLQALSDVRKMKMEDYDDE